MRLPRICRGLLAFSCAVAGTLAVHGPANALSCIDPAAIAQQAPLVFTGRIATTENKRLFVRVHEVWKGDLDVRTLWLATDRGLDGWWDALPGRTVQDGYSSRRLWLFIPEASSGRLQISPCSAGPLTGPWRISVERPASAHPPTDEPVTSAHPRDDPAVPAASVHASGIWPLAGVSGAGLAAGAIGVLVVRRRRHRSG